MSSPGQVDHGLEALLSLHGQEVILEDGCKVRCRAWLTDPSEAVPHGVRYSMTLHDRDDTRLLGFDNAHALRVRKRQFQPRIVIRDHWHLGNEHFVYCFESAEKLLDDFWRQVFKYLNREE